MEHGIGSGSTVPGCQARLAEGVMVRRLSVASLDSGAESPVYGEEPSASADRADPAAKPLRAGGGRWVVRPTRVMLRAAILIIGYCGVTAILLDETPSNRNGTGNDTGANAAGFPVALGEAFAMRFWPVYLNYRLGTATKRARRLAAFISANCKANDPKFGWNGSGIPVTQSAEAAGIDVRSADTAVVALLSTVNGQPMELGVPRYAPGGGLVVSGAPARLTTPPGATLPGAVGSDGIASLQVPAGNATRDSAVTVDWPLPGQVGTGTPRLTATYDTAVVDQQSGRWYVKDIRASTQPMGTQ